MQTIPKGRALLDPYKLLARTGLSVGMYYADLGCGTLGHFVFPAASIVGEEGRVYAVDILKSALQAVEREAQREGFEQVEALWADIERPGGLRLPKKRIDVISLVNTTGLLLKPGVFENIKSVLKPEGKLLLVDWNDYGAFGLGPSVELRVDFSDVQRAVQMAGGRVLETFRAGPYHWGTVCRL